MTNTPSAGWYTDPADPSRQRWWGGAEWTHDVRPMPEPVAPAWAAPQAEARMVPAPTFDPQVGNAAWQNSTQRFAAVEPPSNGYATAGLVLSILPLQLFGVILSIIGLVRATNLTHEGAPPIGRKRAIWGLALGLAGPLVFGVLTAIAIPVYLGQQQQALDAQQQVAEELDVPVEEVLTEADGSPVVYNRAEYEQLLLDSWAADSNGATMDWIECPDNVDMVVGAEISCKFAYQAVTHVFTVTITDNKGGVTATLDGRTIQQ